MGGRVLSFPLFGYEVHIDGSAMILLAMVGFRSAGGQVNAYGLAIALLTILVVVSGVLVHELGHALVADRMGMRTSHILLHGFGGVCVYRGTPRPRQRLLIAVAGPAAGLLLGVVGLVAAVLVGDRLGPAAARLLGLVASMNLFWSVFNLLPMQPLDGGTALRSLLGIWWPAGRAASVTRWVSLALGALVLAGGLASGELFLAFIGGMVLFQNWQR